MLPRLLFLIKKKILIIKSSKVIKNKINNLFYNYFLVLPNNLKTVGYSDTPSTRNLIIECGGAGEADKNLINSSSKVKIALTKSSLNINETKDRFYFLSSDLTIKTKFMDKYIDFSFDGRKTIKQK